MDNQQLRPKGKVQRPFLLREVGTSVPKWVDPNENPILEFGEG